MSRRSRYNEGMKKDKITKLNKYFKNQSNILAVYLFGSHATNRAGKLSDLDLGVVLQDKINPSTIMNLRLKFIGEISKLLNDNNIDIVILNITSPLLQQQAIITGQLIYTSSKEKTCDYEIMTQKTYDDAMYLRNIYYRYLHQKVKTNTMGE